mmetsp:Transcript_74134/g.196966  ORF Transcript_74134/g.196966 Transcript_74134/m.196966 type:complete len:204 (-) Transcript_74134:93-704(-)
MARLALLAVAAGALIAHAAEPKAATPANSSSPHQPQLRGNVGQAADPQQGAAKAATPAPTPAPATAGNASHAERAAQVLAAARAGVAKRNATAAAPDGEVDADWLDWGHGHQGETCCMCSYQYGGATGTVVIYAAEDYDNNNFWGSHGAYWHCEHECEDKCDYHSGGHKFGCLDEDHLRSLGRVLRRARGFRVEHANRFGNLC